MLGSDKTLPIIHWRFPDTAKFGRVIPKEKLYQQANVSAALKQQFVEQVGQIKWAYKLSEGTSNLSKTESVNEIEIIEITLKSRELDTSILTTIDKAIPHPTLFVLKRYHYNQSEKTAQDGTGQIRIVAAHKAKATSASNKETWQQSQYLKSAWFHPDQVQPQKLPIATSLQRLYEQLLEALIPSSFAPKTSSSALDEKKSAASLDKANKPPNQISESVASYEAEAKNQSIEEKLATLAEIETLGKKLHQVKAKRDKEKQFNRRRELNDQYKSFKKQLNELQSKI